jgi:hypothetical protein
MLGLDKIVAGARLRGVAGPAIVDVVRTEWIGADALNVFYRGADGPAEVLLFRDAETRLELVQASRAFGFDGDGASGSRTCSIPTLPSTARGSTRCRIKSQPFR